MKVRTLNLKPEAAEEFRGLFFSKEEDKAQRKEAFEGKKLTEKLVTKRPGAIKDGSLAVEIDAKLIERQINYFDSSEFMGHYVEEEDGSLRADLTVKTDHPGFLASFFDSHFGIFFRIKCTRYPDKTVVTVHRLASAFTDKFGCLIGIFFGFFTFAIGGLLIWLSFRKGIKLSESSLDALADALEARLG